MATPNNNRPYYIAKQYLSHFQRESLQGLLDQGLSFLPKRVAYLQEQKRAMEDKMSLEQKQALKERRDLEEKMTWEDKRALEEHRTLEASKGKLAFWKTRRCVSEEMRQWFNKNLATKDLPYIEKPNKQNNISFEMIFLSDHSLFWQYSDGEINMMFPVDLTTGWVYVCKGMHTFQWDGIPQTYFKDKTAAIILWLCVESKGQKPCLLKDSDNFWPGFPEVPTD